VPGRVSVPAILVLVLEDEQGAANSSEAGPSNSIGEELHREQTGHGSCRLQASDCRLSDACLATIAQITSLKELQLFNHIDLTDAGMLELTALKQLTWLEVEGPVALLNEVVPCTQARLPSNVSAHGQSSVMPQLLCWLLLVQ